jgi:hypothetical protein
MTRKLATSLSLVLSSVLFSASLGKDLNWDILNYHLYSPHLFLNGRMHLDFMGGGPQSYFNPLPFVPFYAMVRGDWPAWLIGAVLAAVHSLSLVALYKLASERLFAAETESASWVLLAVALGSASPLFWGLVGSSFSDPTIAVLVLWALLALCTSRPFRPALKSLFLAGLLLGAATGLKLSNVVFLVAGIAAVIAMPLAGGVRPRLVSIAAFLASSLLGGIATHGLWSWMLWREFGNPVFPLFNEVFRSPDFPAVSLAHNRFVPEGLGDAAVLPFHMARSTSWVYVENAAPDIRPGLLAMAALLAALMALIRRAHGAEVAPAHGFRARAHAVPVFWTFYFTAIVMWLATSANGRYAAPLFLLLGPALALLGRRLLADSLARVFLGVALLVQIAVFVMSGNPRWNPEAWGDRWFRFEAVEELRSQPRGYLSMNINSSSFIAPFVHRDSGFLALQGILPLLPGGYAEERVQRFLRHYDGRLAVLLRLGETAKERVRNCRFPQSKHPAA